MQALLPLVVAPTDPAVSRSEDCWIRLNLQSPFVQVSECANPFHPLQAPGLLSGPVFGHIQEISADVRPTESQQGFPLLDLVHRLVSRVAVDDEPPSFNTFEVFFGHPRRARRVEDKDYRRSRVEHPHIPFESHLAFDGMVDQPTGLVCVSLSLFEVLGLDALHDRLEERGQVFETIGHRT